MTPIAGSVGVITGASGFLGRAMLSAMPATATVFVTYNGQADFPAWASRLPADVRPIRIDLARDRLAGTLGTEVDWALCLAARVVTATSRADPVGELTAAAGPAFNSVAGLRAHRIVHVSSGSVYETLSGRLSPERVLSPRLPYAIAKLAGELLVRSYAHTEPWIVRFFGAYGPGEPSFKITRRLLCAFQSGIHEFELTGDGSNRIDPMHIGDAVAALGVLCTSNHPPATIDLCQGESVTMASYVQMVHAAVHPDAPASQLQLRFTGRAHEEMQGFADPAPADAITGLCRRPLSEGLEQYAEWQLRPSPVEP